MPQPVADKVAQRRKAMKTTMKFNRNSLILRICAALTVLTAVPAVPGYARSTIGINSFHVLDKNPGNSYSCLYENWAAVVNGCNHPVSLTFDLPIDNVGWHEIDVVNSPWGYGSFECQAITFDPHGNAVYYGTEATFNPSGQETLKFYTFVSPADSITIYCWNVPNGRGVTSLNWTP
jgi:hypothetical protein